MSTGGAFSGTTSGTTRDSQGGVFNNVNSNVSADAGTGSGSTAEFLALLAAEEAARIAGDLALAADIATEIAARMAADTAEAALRVAGDAALEASKQDNLTAGDNITIVNDVISSTGGGGSAPIVTTYTLRLDFNQVGQPLIVVNSGDAIPVVNYLSDSITDSEIPTTSDVNVNGVPFILGTDYMISSGILQFTDFDLVENDGDVIIISATTVS